MSLAQLLLEMCDYEMRPSYAQTRLNQSTGNEDSECVSAT